MNPTLEAWLAAVGILTLYVFVCIIFIGIAGAIGERRRRRKAAKP